MSPHAVTIIVHGQPGPQGSKAFKGISKTTGRAILAEQCKSVKPWRKLVAAEAQRVMLGRVGHPYTAPLDGPLIARMVFTMPKPKSAPKRRETFPDRMPDLSKLCRSTEDALTTAKVWADDARVVGYSRLAKVFPGEDPEALDRPGVRIVVQTLASYRLGEVR
jgi:Holliday junction resolvase RusA-like endonuclease